MANVLTSNPWKLDSTGVVTTNRVHVESVNWAGQAANDLLVLKDAAGHVVFSVKATGTDNYFPTLAGRSGEEWQGLTVDTIGGGVAYLTYR